MSVVQVLDFGPEAQLTKGALDGVVPRVTIEDPTGVDVKLQMVRLNQNFAA